MQPPPWRGGGAGNRVGDDAGRCCGSPTSGCSDRPLRTSPDTLNCRDDGCHRHFDGRGDGHGVKPHAAPLGLLHNRFGDPSDDAIRYLIRQGISRDAMCFPYAIRSALVEFPPEDGFPLHPNDGFHFNEDCPQALILRAEDYGITIDLIAWSARTGELAAWRGVGWCLGATEQIDSAASEIDGGALRVHRTPLEWLLADRDGIVIIDPETAAAVLRHAQAVSFADRELAEDFMTWLPPKSTVNVFIEGIET